MADNRQWPPFSAAGAYTIGFMLTGVVDIGPLTITFSKDDS
jgi:hypothetical protein